MGILAAIAIPRLTGFQQTARARAHTTNVKVLTSAGTLYVAEKGNPGTAVTATESSPGVLAGYVEDWPTDPWERSGVVYTVGIATDGTVSVTGVTVPTP